MERFTEKLSDGRSILKNHYASIHSAVHGFFLEGEAIDRLAEYEILEEQNRLLKLPCAVGDTVYTINHLPSGKIAIGETVADAFMCALGMLERRFGKTIFLTLEAAESALKELEGKNGNTSTNT